MGELRKDYILDRWVVVSSGRGKRPREFERPGNEKKQGIDYFAPGHEHLTPPEKGRVDKDGRWLIRWFDNKFPALTQDGSSVIETHNKFYTFSHGYGVHEVVVETPDNRQLYELDKNHIAEVLKVYANRIEELSKLDNIKYVLAFKNHGPLGGTSIIHSHSQVCATSVVPKTIREECAAVRKFVSCPYCEIIEREKNSKRACYENDEVVAFCPYASRYNYEVWIFPKKHITSFSDVPFNSMADILKKILSKIHDFSGISYNYAIHYSPEGENLHVHIEVYPDIAIWGGFERGSGMVINSVSPESAASFYRGELE